MIFRHVRQSTDMRMEVDGAKALDKRQLVSGLKRLITKENDAVIEKRSADVGKRRRVKRTREVDTMDQGPERAGERLNRYGRHESLPTKWRLRL